MLRLFDERVLVRDVEHTSGIGEIIIFYNFYFLSKHKNFYSRIEQSLKFILIYNLNLNLSFYFYLRARSLWSMLGVDFYFPCNLFHFRSSAILVESPSTIKLNNFFSSFCTKSSRRLSVLDYGEFPNVSKNCRWCVVESRTLKSSHGNSRVNFF